MRKFTIIFKNRNNLALMVGEDETILDVAEAAGHVLPVGCRYGGCISCAAKLLEGKVRQPNGTALNRRQSGQGYILLCVARPQMNCIIDAGVESHDTLYLNPFAAAGTYQKPATGK